MKKSKSNIYIGSSITISIFYWIFSSSKLRKTTIAKWLNKRSFILNCTKTDFGILPTEFPPLSWKIYWIFLNFYICSLHNPTKRGEIYIIHIIQVSNIYQNDTHNGGYTKQNELFQTFIQIVCALLTLFGCKWSPPACSGYIFSLLYIRFVEFLTIYKGFLVDSN